MFQSGAAGAGRDAPTLFPVGPLRRLQQGQFSRESSSLLPSPQAPNAAVPPGGVPLVYLTVPFPAS